MDHAAFTAGRMHIVRIDPGEDVLASVESFLQSSGVRQAIVMGGYGTLASYHIHWVAHNRIPAQDRHGRGEAGIELLSMSGLVVAGKPHIHMTVSTPDGAFGGHLEPGCIAYVVCEVFLAEVEGPTLSRLRVPVMVDGMGEGHVTRLTFEHSHQE